MGSNYQKYPETFIILASVGAYSVRPAKEGAEIKFIMAYVRNCF